MISKGFSIFSYRLIERWERELLFSNSYNNTNYILGTKTVLVHVLDRKNQDVIVDREFYAQPIKDWYSYRFNNNKVTQTYPRDYKWFRINTPSKKQISYYMPDIIKPGDTIVFDAEPRLA